LNVDEMLAERVTSATKSNVGRPAPEKGKVPVIATSIVAAIEEAGEIGNACEMISMRATQARKVGSASTLAREIE